MRYYVDVNAVQGGDGSSEKPFRKLRIKRWLGMR